MKKHMAIITTILMILSLFSSIAFAEPTSAVLVINEPELVEFGGTNFKTFTGIIISTETGALINANNRINIVKDKNNNGLLDSNETNPEDIITTVDASGGQFSLTISASTSGQFIIYGESNDKAIFNNADLTDIAYRTYRVLPKMQLNSPNMLTWTYPVNNQVVVSGSFANNDGEFTDTNKLSLNYIGPNNSQGNLITNASMVDNTAFGFLFDGNSFTDLGEIGIYYNGVLALQGGIYNQPNLVVNGLSSNQEEQNITITGVVENYISNNKQVSCFLNSQETVLDLNDNGEFTWNLSLEEGINFIKVSYGEGTNYADRYRRDLYYNTSYMNVYPQYDQSVQKYSGTVNIAIQKNDLQINASELRAELYTVDTSNEEISLIKNIVLNEDEYQYVSDEFEASVYEGYYVKLYNNNDFVKYARLSVYPRPVFTSDSYTDEDPYTVEGFLAYAEDYSKFEYSLNNSDFVTVSNIDANGNFSFDVDLQEGSNYIKTYLHMNDGGKSGAGFNVTFESDQPQDQPNIDWYGPNNSSQQNRDITITGRVDNKINTLNYIVAIFNDVEQVVSLNDSGEFSFDVSLIDGINFVKVLYKDDNTVYDSYTEHYNYNAFSMHIQPIYDDVNNRFSGLVHLDFATFMLDESYNTIRAELYTIEHSEYLEYVKDINFTFIENRYQHSNIELDSREWYYLKLYDENNNIIGYSHLTTYPKAVLKSGYEYDNTSVTLEGYLIFADDYNEFNIAINNGDYFTVDNIDSNGNFSVDVQLEPGNNEIKTKIEFPNGGSKSVITILCTASSQPLSITTQSLPYAIKDQDYNFTLSATGGTEPYQWAINTPIPQGMSFNNGTLTGKPSVTGDYTLTFAVQDASSNVVTKDFNFSIKETVVRPTLKVATVITIPNATVEVPVTLSDANGITAIQYELRFNSSVVEFNSFELGTQLNNWVIDTNVVEDGVLRVVMVSSSGLSTDTADLGNLKFNVLGEIGTSTNLVIKTPFATNTYLNDIIPKVKYGKVEVYVSYGDVTGDEKINVVDVVRIMRHIDNTDPLNGADLMAGDVNGDHSVNQVDITLILSHIVKEINEFPVG